ncbi:hypothetical protein RHGRI_027628 [Rhododendron griersonianum]|uniref:CS domain-containing protein n=1 Tax=Rhododendron griersonianum TaxID=479676 RepID=A0AAV6J481_9ERIC|nr:hypothetical protein RHGRI_027628 [Rhododendron griersonianum]
MVVIVRMGSYSWKRKEDIWIRVLWVVVSGRLFGWLAVGRVLLLLHSSQKVFEWDQTLEEVNIYITLPPNVPTKLFHCKIQPKHVEVGIKGNPPYLNHDLSSPVKTDCSFWTIEDDIMHITLQKRDKGQTWASPILGQGQLDPYATDLEQKRLMLQRFQEEVSQNC